MSLELRRITLALSLLNSVKVSDSESVPESSGFKFPCSASLLVSVASPTVVAGDAEGNSMDGPALTSGSEATSSVASSTGAGAASASALDGAGGNFDTWR